METQRKAEENKLLDSHECERADSATEVVDDDLEGREVGRQPCLPRAVLSSAQLINGIVL